MPFSIRPAVNTEYKSTHIDVELPHLHRPHLFHRHHEDNKTEVSANVHKTEVSADVPNERRKYYATEQLELEAAPRFKPSPYASTADNIEAAYRSRAQPHYREDYRRTEISVDAPRASAQSNVNFDATRSFAAQPNANAPPSFVGQSNVNLQTPQSFVGQSNVNPRAPQSFVGQSNIHANAAKSFVGQSNVNANATESFVSKSTTVTVDAPKSVASSSTISLNEAEPTVDSPRTLFTRYTKTGKMGKLS